MTAPDHEVVVMNAVIAARRFYDVPDEVRTVVDVDPATDGAFTDESVKAHVTMHYGHLFVEIRAPSNRAVTPSRTWAVVAHEVAHVQTREVAAIVGSTKGIARDLLIHAVENATTRFERLFAKVCPYPGDDWFTLLCTPAAYVPTDPVPEGHDLRPAMCRACGRCWIAIAPVERVDLRCPACRQTSPQLPPDGSP